MSAPSEQEALEFLVRTFRELTADLDVGDLTSQTMLKTLGLRSIVLINALAEIQDHFGLENRLLDRLLAAGVPLFEHRLGDLAAYVVAASGSRVG